MMLIALDVDGVLADILTPLKQLSGLPRFREITDPDLTGAISQRAWRALDVFVDPKPYPGARRFVGLLRAQGHRVIAVTSPPDPTQFWGQGRWMEDRDWWLQECLGFGPGDICHCRDKSLVPSDLLLDDSPEHVRNRPGGVLMRRSYNRDYDGASVGTFGEFLSLIRGES